MSSITKLDPEEFKAALAAVEEVRSRREREAAEAERLAARRAAVRVLAPDGGRIVLFSANQHADLTEGRGGTTSRGLFLFVEDAVRANYVLDGVGSTNSCKVSEVEVFASFEEWLSATKAPLNKDRLAEIAEHSPSVQEVVAHRPTLQKK